MPVTPEPNASRLSDHLSVSLSAHDSMLALRFITAEDRPLYLHWGLCRKRGRAWQAPPESTWPGGTVAFDRHAVQTPFQWWENQQQLTLHLPTSLDAQGLCFVLFFPEDQSWDDNDGQDYAIDLHAARRQASQERLEGILADWDPQRSAEWRYVALSEGEQLAIATEPVADADEGGGEVRLLLVTDAVGEPQLHWGLTAKPGATWQQPSQAIWPAGTQPFDDRAARTPFRSSDDLWRLELAIPIAAVPHGRWLPCVIYDAMNDRWLKEANRDICIPLRASAGASLIEIAERIVEAEVGDHSWTLMHRFHLAHDLLEQAGTDSGALELIYAWLRYSAIRQLDWQRKYNTKPRELAHAQDRLTRRIAQMHRQHSGVRPTLRRILATVGRGGPGQEVRDGVLNIMHRHHVKEKHGTWLEQWHQKLHNNTTPDDIAICEAYLNFLRGDGDERAYDRTLAEAGIDRSRLASFERPITTSPDFYPDKKDGLIGDFEQFLRLLKIVHAGTDLETSLDTAAYALDASVVDRIRHALYDGADTTAAIVGHVRELTVARERLSETIEAATDAGVRRDLLYLDVATEAHLRTWCERLPLGNLSFSDSHPLIGDLLANLALSEAVEEYAICRDDWPDDPPDTTTDQNALLYAVAVAERTDRAVRETTDILYRTLQQHGEELGRRLRVDAWTIPIFGEEVVRGTLAFALGRLLRRYESSVRQAAGLPAWQLISDPGPVEGRLRHVATLRELQGQPLEEPTLVLADHVEGDEDIPPQVRAIVTPDPPDMLSHVAIRARNGRVLLIGALEHSLLTSLMARTDDTVALRFSHERGLSVEEASGTEAETAEPPRGSLPSLAEVDREAAVLTPAEFRRDRVGGKSLTQAQLRDLLPDAIRMPPSLALSFGMFDRVLADPSNRDTAERHAELCGQVDHAPDRVLPQLRETIGRLKAPRTLHDELTEKAQQQQLNLPAWSVLWPAITSVWASKWLDRAYWARRHAGIPHDQLHMAVLIQQTVPADYAFIVHTIHPLTADTDVLYGDLVPGLGDALASNHPGRPLSFTARKSEGEHPVPQIETLPSKSVGLFGGGIVCRSDSNGEDLPHFAGAGLYASYFVPAPDACRLRYRDHPLVRDASWRDRMLGQITQLATQVEQVLEAPQDIEGAICQDQLYLLQSRPQVGLSSERVR